MSLRQGFVICSIFKTFVVKEYLFMLSLSSPTATKSGDISIRVTNSPRLPGAWEFPGTSQSWVNWDKLVN